MAQTISVLGIDIAKLVFHIVGMDDAGQVILRKRIPRSELLHCIATLPPPGIGMEACGSAHDWARCCREHGHDVRLIAPQFVKAYVKSPKNDGRDAEAICEAVTRSTMRFVLIKQLEQQDLQALHRVRGRLIKARTALVKEMRGLLHAYGIILPQGMTKFRTLVVRKLQKEQCKLTALSTEVFWQLYDEFLVLETRLAYDDKKLAAIGRAHPECQRLQTIPWIGSVTATALSAAISHVTPFKNGRQLTAWLGVIPREHSTNGKPRLLGISQCGNVYLGQLLIYGARATPGWVETKHDDRGRWLKALIERWGKKRAAVALANKNARIAWALLTHNQAYRVRTAA
ncbi:MAG: IS110 family transposase [Candidatus Entotheonellia bacterium]